MRVYTQATPGRYLKGVISEQGEFLKSFELPQRILNIEEGLRNAGCEIYQEQGKHDLQQFLSFLEQIHKPSYLKHLQYYSDKLGNEEIFLTDEYYNKSLYPETVLFDGILETALQGAYVTAKAASGLVQERLNTTYALCRPPGHHAGYNYLGGYCYINNAMVAACTLITQGISKVAIIDLDYHFGNGTSDISQKHPAIHFSSIHSCNIEDYPHHNLTSDQGSHHFFIGLDGSPLIADYLLQLEYIYQAIAQFDAQAIVVSMGYDTAMNDPHGSWEFSPLYFEKTGQSLSKLGLPICIVQEGGYHLPSLTACAEALANGFLSELERKTFYNDSNSKY